MAMQPDEPIYNGKTLSVWAYRYSTNNWSTPNHEWETEAQSAIQHIGTNGIPILLRMLSTRESPLRVKLLARIPQPWLARIHLPGLVEYRQQLDQRRTAGAYGFTALGVQAKSALPALKTLLEDKDERVRYLAFFTLRCLGPVAKEALPLMIAHLDDPEFTVQDEAVMALGTIHEEPDQVVPIIMHFLEKNHGNAILCQEAIDALGKFGAKATPAVPMLVGLLDNEHAETRSWATNALKLIDPEAAAKAGVK